MVHPTFRSVRLGNGVLVKSILQSPGTCAEPAAGLTWCVWLHGHYGGGVWEHVDDVTRHVLPLECVPFKENAVHVHFGAEPKSVPHHVVAGTHVQSEEVPVHEAVHSCKRRQTGSRGGKSKQVNWV